MPSARNSSRPGRRIRCASREAAMPAASNAPATRISSPSVTPGEGMRPGRARRTVPAVHEEISPPELTQAIARLSALFGPRQGGIRALEGGVSNRNLLVNFGGTDYVVRLPGKDTELLGIDREAERLATRRAADLGMAPRVAAMLDHPPCLVTCYVEGKTMTAEELRDPGVVAEVAHALRAFHDCGLELPGRFEPYELAR